MKITPPLLPTIHESHSAHFGLDEVEEAASSTEAPAGAPIEATMEARMIEHRVRAAPNVVIQVYVNQRQTPPVRDAFKQMCHTSAMACGLVAIPSIGFITFGAYGAIVPACLVVLGVLFAALAGRPTPKQIAASEARNTEMRNYDFRGMT